jgi:hypothetical protein
LDSWISESQKAWSVAHSTHLNENSSIINVARGSQIGLDNEIAGIAEKFTDPEAALKSMLQYDAGMTYDTARGMTVSPEGLRWFMFGAGPLAALRAKTFDLLADIVSKSDVESFKGLKYGSKEWDDQFNKIAGPYLFQLHAISKGKWEPSTLKELVVNSVREGGRDGVLTTLSPRLGVDVNPGNIAFGLKASEKDGLRVTETLRTSDSSIKRFINRQMSERPGMQAVNMSNSIEVANALIKYGVAAKLPVADIGDAVGKVLLAADTYGSTTTSVDAAKTLFDKIGNSLVENLDKSTLLFKGTSGKARKDAVATALRESTRIFYAGVTGRTAEETRKMGTNSDVPYVVDDLGNKLYMPSNKLDSELLTGYLTFPNIDEWSAGLSRIGAALNRLPSTENAYTFTRNIYDNFFRTSLLVFRASYILRNSAEQQVRMYLNGHSSIYNDPVTLIGMTIGSPKSDSKLGGFFHKAYGPYQNTVLGTDFYAGADEEAAFANHVQDYWSWMRQGRSMGDPRSVNAGIRQGWDRIDVNAPAFDAGWANELIMLNRSASVKAVMGDLPQDFVYSNSSADATEKGVAFILSDHPMAVKYRETMMGFDERYAQLFQSPAMTRDYLFTSPNSVLNQVKHYTMDDAVLNDFVRFGKWDGNGISFELAKEPKIEKRIDLLTSALKTRFRSTPENERALVENMKNANVNVPHLSTVKGGKASGLIDKFFEFANKIEKLTAVGPEYRMAYWDRVAELLPGLRASDVDRAMNAAKESLTPLQRMNPDGKVSNIGKTHPAWAALNKAKKENTDGLMSLDDIHSIASTYAMEQTKALFYDAARRNNFWSATRLIFPFGQAWGNTILEWTRLASNNPIQVYKAEKAFNALNEEGSSAIYDTGEGWLYQNYAEGAAPWEQDPNGGFFYSNQYGDTAFMTPLVGRASGVGVGILSALNGFNVGVPAMDAESSTTSLNIALGQDSVIPGSSFVAGMALNLLPDSALVDQIKNVVQPYGQPDITESAIPAWGAKSIAGLGAIPVVGPVLGNWLSALSPAQKNKNIIDAVAILSASSDYNLQDPLSVAQLKEDAKSLASSMLLINGFAQNISPVTPGMKAGVENSGMTVALGLFGRMYPLYLAENGGDTVAAKEQMLRELGPSAIFAVTGNKKGYSRIPSSEAKNWAMSDSKNLDIARAYPDYFSLFFTKGDPTDLTSRLWIESMTQRDVVYKNSDEVVDENIAMMQRVQRQRVDFFVANGLLSTEQGDAAKDDIKEAYKDTASGTTFNSLTATDQIDQIKGMFDRSPSLQKTNAGKGFALAMQYRDEALKEARIRSGDPSATLGGKKVAGIKQAYINDLNVVLANNPDFILLHNLMAKEW